MLFSDNTSHMYDIIIHNNKLNRKYIFAERKKLSTSIIKNK